MNQEPRRQNQNTTAQRLRAMDRRWKREKRVLRLISLFLALVIVVLLCVVIVDFQRNTSKNDPDQPTGGEPNPGATTAVSYTHLDVYKRQGTIYTQNDTTLLNVQDTQKRDGIYLHLCTVVSGVLQVGDSVIADINDETREAIRRNHSACHLLQAALRKVCLLYTSRCV